ncbi:hypothetical protein PROFUN_08844 [Planoprotostelium fungivorum]|uniref:Uncharacterized protein n=1 Tax=Planoprotostelium fungivorum TaxID=1890364 RepID=A0A2P6NIZ0_9EUKA|nr:hypothetical protein PROFUN_08844 [Planoprotostelium fungivorum]
MLHNSRIIATSFHGIKQCPKLSLNRVSRANHLSKRTLFVGDIDVKGPQIKAGGAIFKIKSLVDLPTEMHTPLTELNELNTKQKKAFPYRVEVQPIYRRLMLYIISGGKENFFQGVESAIRYIWSACNDPDHRGLTTLLTDSTSLPEPLSYLKHGHKMMHDNQQTLTGQDKEITSMTHEIVDMYLGTDLQQVEWKSILGLLCQFEAQEEEERIIFTRWGAPVNLPEWKLVQIEPFPVPFVLKKD